MCEWGLWIMNMTLSLITLISILCNKGFIAGKDKCIESFNKCYLEAAKSDWAQEYVPEVRKVKVFYHCAFYQGWRKN